MADSPFEYRPLRENHFRFIHFFGPDEHGKRPIGIIQRPLHTAEYHALSYTWGGEKPSISITCNGKQLLITSNLHHALRTLSNQGYHDLWADAICIDQSNKEEEAIQEPLIGTVYSEAHEALIWLGPAGPYSDLAMNGIAGCLQELIADAEDGAGRIVLQDELEDLGLPGRDDPVWDGLIDIYCRSWSSRVWTAQELVFAKRATVFCGSKAVSWDELAALTTLLLPLSRLSSGDTIKRLLHINYVAYLRGGTITGNLILDITSLAQNRDASEPADKVYGVLAFLRENQRALLEVRYSATHL